MCDKALESKGGGSLVKFITCTGCRVNADIKWLMILLECVEQSVLKPCTHVLFYTKTPES